MKIIKNNLFKVRPDAKHDWQNLPAVRGKSAYQVAVDHGYQGTEEEWLKETAITADKLNDGVQIWMDKNPEIISRAAGSVIVQSEEPQGNETATVWIDPAKDQNQEYHIPEVKDDLINAVDTWSSQKIVNYIQEQLKLLK